jgi:serine/threonine-protein kinase PRP4
MFAEDADADAFAAAEAARRAAPGGGRARAGLADAYDDPEGYYRVTVGEVMTAGTSPTAARYLVTASVGRGVFSGVVRARSLPPGADPAAVDPAALPEVAIKIIRANDVMRKAGALESTILKKLAGADPAGRRHCVRLLSSFDYRGHLCLVFEALDADLREVAKKYGRGVGLSLAAVRAYGAQLLSALRHLAACGVLHADVKPDNILVSADRSRAVLADFGSAMFAGDNEVTPYLVSRFYRAPEVILGLPYTHAMDVWALACVLLELFTGRVAFPGRTNNEMLALFQEMKGALPRRMVKKGAFAARHFEGERGVFARAGDDAATGAPMRTLVDAPTVVAGVAARLAGMGGAPREVAALADVLDRMFALDPDRRASPGDCLRHPFFAGVVGRQA